MTGDMLTGGPGDFVLSGGTAAEQSAPAGEAGVSPVPFWGVAAGDASEMITSSRLSLSHSEMTSIDCWPEMSSASSSYSNCLDWDFWDTSGLADGAGVSSKESEEEVVGLSTSSDWSCFTAERFASGLSGAGALASVSTSPDRSRGASVVKRFASGLSGAGALASVSTSPDRSCGASVVKCFVSGLPGAGALASVSTSPDCSRGASVVKRFGFGCSTAGALAFLFPRSRPASEGLLNADSGVLCSFVDVPLEKNKR